jgi:hypothetical protein
MWLLPFIGIAATAAVGLVTWLSPEIPAGKKWLVISLTAISVGAIGFNGWWESHTKDLRQQANATAIKVLSALVDEADAIQQTFLSTDDVPTIKKRYADWLGRTNKTITEKLDSSYATSFRSAPNVAQMPLNHNIEGDGYWAAIEGKKIVLNNIIAEIRQSK